MSENGHNEIEMLKAEMEQMRAEMAQMKADQNMAIVPANEPTSRRRMLKKLGIGAAAAGLTVAGMAAAGGSEASANTGDPLILGRNNFSSTPNIAQNTTQVRVTTGSGFTPAAIVGEIGDNGSLAGLFQYGAVVGITNGSAPDGTDKVPHGMYGITTSPNGAGVMGQNQGSVTTFGQFAAGVTGLGSEVPGVLGINSTSNLNTSTAGVVGKGKVNPGVRGIGDNIGVIGTGRTGVYGVGNSDPASIGVEAQGNDTAFFGYNSKPNGGTVLMAEGSAFKATAEKNPLTDGAAIVARANNSPAIQAATNGSYYGVTIEGADRHLYLKPTNFEGRFGVNGYPGDMFVDKLGILWFCVGNSDWRKIAGVKTAGALHVMPTPERLIDTRSDLVGTGDKKGQVLGFAPADKPADANTFTYTITKRAGANGGEVPEGARAIVGNITVVADDKAASGGFLSMWPTGGAVPATSVLNYKPGQIAFNNFTVGLSSDGKLSLASFRNAHVIIDVVGYYL